MALDVQTERVFSLRLTNREDPTLWNKTRNDEAPAPRSTTNPGGMAENVPPARAAAPAPTYAPPAAPRAEAAGPRHSAAIGPSMTIKGEIRAREELMVDGEVEGSLESQSLLTVGPNGKVRANIKAREVVVYGSVRGNVEVAEKIAIRDHGSLVGDIKAAGISIDDGAYFKGSIDIVRPEPKVTSKPVKNEAKVEAGVGG
jgi:cytoskeletal protein CcmA (bactofilin family)